MDKDLSVKDQNVSVKGQNSCTQSVADRNLLCSEGPEFVMHEVGEGPGEDA